MTSLELTGWRIGVKTVSLIQAIRSHTTASSLQDAKSLVEALLDGRTVVVHFATEEQKAQFRQIAEGLGAIAR